MERSLGGFSKTCLLFTLLVSSNSLIANDTDKRIIVYPKSRSINVVQTQEQKKAVEKSIARLTGDTSASLTSLEVKVTEGPDYEVTNPIQGRVRKADVYETDELLLIDHRKLTISEKDEWTKVILAMAADRIGETHRASLIIESLTDETREKPDVAILSVKIKMHLSLHDSALIEIAALEWNHPEFPLSSFLRGIILTEMERYDEAIDQFMLAEGKIGTATDEIRLRKAICRFGKKQYELVPMDLENVKFSDRVRSNLTRILRARSLVLKPNPDYDKALAELSLIEEDETQWPFLARIDTAIIHSCRSDTKNRKPEEALKQLLALRNTFFANHLKYYGIASMVANLSFNNFVEAEMDLDRLKKMFVSPQDLPDLKLIEESINQRKAYVPSGKIPISTNLRYRIE